MFAQTTVCAIFLFRGGANLYTKCKQIHETKGGFCEKVQWNLENDPHWIYSVGRKGHVEEIQCVLILWVPIFDHCTPVLNDIKFGKDRMKMYPDWNVVKCRVVFK
jgi:hypothetical protein